MSKLNDTAERVEKTVLTRSDKFIEGVDKTQTAILRSINGLIRELELNPNGTIKTNGANLKVLRSIKSDLNRIIVNPAYRKKLDDYLKGFTELKTINDRYFTFLSSKFVPGKQVFKEILDSAIGVTKNSLLESGISESVIKPISDILTQNITGGALVGDLEETLRLYINGDNQRLGRLERHVTQISRDALNQYSANYTQSVSSDLGLRWFYYSGGVKQNTRSYCKKRVGKYFTIEQIRNVPKEWSGRIPGTNSSNILTNRGGHGCIHQYYPVLEESVPDQFK